MAVIVAVVAAFSAVIAAVIASRAQIRVQKAEAESRRLGALEERLAQRKFEVYQPMLNVLHRMILGEIDIAKLSQREQDEIQDMSTSFGTWLAVFGSDESVSTYQRWCQATWHQPVPPPVLFRLWADLMLAARRDIGNVDTSTSVGDLVALRLRDYYEVPANVEAMSLPLNEVCAKYDWTPPWE